MTPPGKPQGLWHKNRTMTIISASIRTTSRVMLATLCLIALSVTFGNQISLAQSSPGEQRYAPVKVLGFNDPNANYRYLVASYNVTQMAANSNVRAFIKVTKDKIQDNGLVEPVGLREQVHTIKFTAPLVDFDLHCVPTHCYMVAVTSKSRQNIELFSWRRTQFDLEAKRDSFSRVSAVKLFRIQSGFYIVLAQEQLHLAPYKLAQEYEEPNRFIGCTILKFVKGHERNIKYHQFIRLPFNPLHVRYLLSVNSNNATNLAIASPPIENHYIVFSIESNWAETGASQAHSFIWSPLNDHFWPHRLPRSIKVVHRPGTQLIQFPTSLPLQQFQTLNQSQAQDYVSPVEDCFHQLERVLADRDYQARQLLESSKSIWRSNHAANEFVSNHPLANISAQVVVHGSVTVLGSLIESPQISLIAGRSSPIVDPPSVRQVGHLINSHSPAIVENKFKQAIFKLDHMRQKLSRAFMANLQSQSQGIFNNPIRFFGTVEAQEVSFGGIENSNVMLNGIPFRQLEHELVSLNGIQDIGTKVVFDGRVVADVLEIHGQINDYYYLKDAIDITSRHVQIIDASGHNYVPTLPGLSSIEFQSIGTAQVMIAPNATINTIRLDDFITRDNRTQLVFGRKSFKRLSMGKLDLAHENVLLNDFNIYRLARNAIHLRNTDANKPHYQTIGGFPVTFTKGVRANRVIVRNMINKHINLTSIIHDTVKSNELSPQQIYGQKNFLNSLQINRLTTEGALNGIEVSQIFNLNPTPPVPDYYRDPNNTMASPHLTAPISGEFRFRAPVVVRGNLNAGLVNGIDLARRAIRRVPMSQNPHNMSSVPPQIVRGHKTFYKPMRVLNSVRLLDQQEASITMGNVTGIPYPMINNIDLRLITAGLDRRKRQPTVIYVEDLVIDGNLNLPNGPPRVTLGNYTTCPIDLIRKRLILAGGEEQIIETPIRVNSLRARSVSIEADTLNGFRFPQDFVLRTPPAHDLLLVEPIMGSKYIDHLIISPSNLAQRRYNEGSSFGIGQTGTIILDKGVSINQVDHGALQTFIRHERQHNSTGEKVFSTMNVYGNLHATRINGNRWPDDILLKSVSSTRGQNSALPYQHKRIYSHLVFLNSSSLQIANQLVLRGPVQLSGRVNGVNLTEFARQSATYGDKDLYSIGRPIRNKIFLGGLTIRGEIRSQGLIDNVNFDEMKRRVVTITPNQREPILITSPKMFMSDVHFQNSLGINYLNDVPMDQYLKRIQFQPDGQTLRITGKKIITGALRIDKNLLVRGLINGVDFADLQARAISLAPSDELAFNKTLTVEGDVFMDNLWIDERNGTIDGVKLTNLLPVGTIGMNELILQAPRVDRRADPFGRVLNVVGSFLDCQVSCNLQPPPQQQLHAGNQTSYTIMQQQQQPVRPVILPAQSVMAYTSRPAFVEGGNQRNFTLTRTTPPYSMSSHYQPPMVTYGTTQSIPQPTTIHHQHYSVLPPSQQRLISSLVQRKPVAITYEREAPSKRLMVPERNALVSNHLELVRQNIISINMIRLSPSSDIVVGFINAPTNDVSLYELLEEDVTHSEYNIKLKSYLQLDQIDFPYNLPTIYHLSVGVATNQIGQNVTSVFSSLGDNSPHELSVLPVEFPNSAMFLKTREYNTLFLLISQDYSINTGMCATGNIISNQLYDSNQPNFYESSTKRAESGVHVYMFIALQNSSSLTSAYFDLYQTLDLPGIDSFEKFIYQGSTYVLAISRSVGRVYLLMLRGYSGFQIVSYMDTPMVEKVTVMLTSDHKPVLMIHQTIGLHRLMESVII